jgi:hypothetical protein
VISLPFCHIYRKPVEIGTSGQCCTSSTTWQKVQVTGAKYTYQVWEHGFARKQNSSLVSRYCVLLTSSQWCTQRFIFEVGSTNSVEDRGQREGGSGGDSK